MCVCLRKRDHLPSAHGQEFRLYTHHVCHWLIIETKEEVLLLVFPNNMILLKSPVQPKQVMLLRLLTSPEAKPVECLYCQHLGLVIKWHSTDIMSSRTAVCPHSSL